MVAQNRGEGGVCMYVCGGWGCNISKLWQNIFGLQPRSTHGSYGSCTTEHIFRCRTINSQTQSFTKKIQKKLIFNQFLVIGKSFRGRTLTRVWTIAYTIIGVAHISVAQSTNGKAIFFARRDMLSWKLNSS